MLLLYVIATLFLAYAIVLLYYWRLWKKVPEWKTQSTSDLSFSLVIPARNEEQNISLLLNAIMGQTNSSQLKEVIVVDDQSEDDTAKVAATYKGVSVVPSGANNTLAFKKAAITTGIKQAKGKWILATDADCVPRKNWITTMASFIEKNGSVFVAGPVLIENRPSVLGYFQSMDFMMLQAITAAVVHHNLMSMCNGANIAYAKQAFESVNGFEGINDIASGDDMLLMYKIQKAFPGKVHYIKSKAAIVTTASSASWKAFFSQRVRWASKARRYQDRRILPVLGLVYGFNLGFLFLAAAAFVNSHLWWWLGALWLGKTVVEWPLFASAAIFFNRKETILLFPFFQPMHILYTIISGTFSQFGKYEWKGRKVR